MPHERWNRWRRTPLPWWQMLFEGAVELARARLVVRFSLRRSLPVLLTVPSAARTNVPPVLARDIEQAITAAGRHLPWQSLCLPNAIAAKRMLQRRGYDATLHLGVGHRENGDLHAHAWLSADDRILIGTGGVDAVSALPTPTHSLVR